jgi:glycosyltransferase involved in cell wall biosynthesis
MFSRSGIRLANSDSTRRGGKVLYLSYDGLTDPLGRAQILPYLVGLAGIGHEIAVISFEKSGRPRAEWEAVRSICSAAGIHWHPERYHARPPVVSTLRDIWRMRRTAERLHRARAFEIVHCRSYIAALVGLRLKRRHGVRFLFDMRGFYVDERIEMGLRPPQSPLFRQVIGFFRKREVEFFREADAIVSLTQAAVPELTKRSSAPITVISCCVDFEQFSLPTAQGRSEARRELGIGETAPVLGYLGSVGSNYLVDEMFALFRTFRQQRKGAKFLFLTPEAPDALIAVAATQRVAAGDMIIRSVGREDVARLMPAADVGISFIRPGKSKLACCPTKLGEMMALGIPLAVNAGIGDVDAVIRESASGVVVDTSDEAGLAAGARALLTIQTSADRIRAEAHKRFDLREGVAAYDSIYRGLAR